LLTVTAITIAVYYFSKEMKHRHVVVLGDIYLVFICYSLGAADYLADGRSWLSKPAGAFIDFLRQPGGIDDVLRRIANSITGSW